MSSSLAMWLALLISASPVHAQEPLAGSDVVVTLAPGLSGEILLDGQRTGVMAPGILHEVSSGPHRIQVRGDCLMGMGFVSVVPGQSGRVAVDLQTTGGFVEVRVVPPTADIWIDGESVGVGPRHGTELACGEHRVEVRGEGLGAQTRELRVEMGEAQTVLIDLTLPAPLPPAPPVHKDRTRLQQGVALGLAAVGVGGIGAGALLQRRAQMDYRNNYLPEFEACEDLACQEEVQDYRSETIYRRYYGSLAIAGLGVLSLSTAGVVGLTREGYPLLGLTGRW